MKKESSYFKVSRDTIRQNIAKKSTAEPVKQSVNHTNIGASHFLKWLEGVHKKSRKSGFVVK